MADGLTRTNNYRAEPEHGWRNAGFRISTSNQDGSGNETIV